MFWVKRKKIVLDAFTTVSAAYNFYPITKMKEAYPDWWKKLPATILQPNNVGIEYPGATIKKCDGLIALYGKGFNIPLWTDLLIETEDDATFKYQMALGLEKPVSEHSREQMGPEFDNVIHIKLRNPWNFSEKTGVEFYFGPAWWNQIKLLPNMFVPQAILNFKYQIGAEINLFLPRIKNRLELEAGQPMIQLIPLTDQEIDVRCHLISEKEMEARGAIHAVTKFHNAYKIKKLALQEKEKSKCPFGFGRK
jgi:hypothetical protein